MMPRPLHAQSILRLDPKFSIETYLCTWRMTLSGPHRSRSDAHSQPLRWPVTSQAILSVRFACTQLGIRRLSYWFCGNCRVSSAVEQRFCKTLVGSAVASFEGLSGMISLGLSVADCRSHPVWSCLVVGGSVPIWVAAFGLGRQVGPSAFAEPFRLAGWASKDSVFVALTIVMTSRHRPCGNGRRRVAVTTIIAVLIVVLVIVCVQLFWDRHVMARD
jgi:hypothetical protein